LNRRFVPASTRETIETRIKPPRAYRRVPLAPGSFGAWLRQLPLKPGRSKVLLHNRRPKANQSAHHAVIDIDTGNEDLQQCADAIIRLRAEYLFSGPCRDEIRFDFSSGHVARWKEWRRGARPTVRGAQVTWARSAAPDASYASFRRYLDTVFEYAGSASLERELLPVPDPRRIEVGDLYVEGGFPGHAVLVVDVAENEKGERIFLLAQSLRPAQDIHILRSFERISPWYRTCSRGELKLPQWTFDCGYLKRFAKSTCEIRSTASSSPAGR